MHPSEQLTNPLTEQPKGQSAADVVIRTDQLTRSFGKQVALQNLSLEVHAGEIFGFLGHNGAGKTTTVRLLNGLLTPTQGHAQVLGFDPVTQGPQLRRKTGVLTETPSLDDRMTAYENLATFASIYGVPKSSVHNRVNELLAIFGLSERTNSRVGGFSKGMKQRLALARALVHQPDLIFLDEPASGLDPVVTRQLHDLILHLSRNEGKTIFLCTHNLSEAQKLCQRVAVLQNGELMALGTPSQLASEIIAEIRLTLEIDPTQADLAIATLAQFTPLPPTVEASGLTVAGIVRDQIPELVAALVAAGVRLYRIDHDEPTLEDVYFALHTAHAASSDLNSQSQDKVSREQKPKDKEDKAGKEDKEDRVSA